MPSPPKLAGPGKPGSAGRSRDPSEHLPPTGGPRMTTVRSADSTTIAYTRAGQGPPLILVDGALCSRSFGPMPKLAEQLTPHFTVYTYARRGRGDSGATKPYSPDREAEDLEALAPLARAPLYLHGTSPRPPPALL